MNNATSTAKRHEEAKLIGHMLSEIESEFEQSGRSNDFIESLRTQFDERKTLSDKQVEALTKFYERI